MFYILEVTSHSQGDGQSIPEEVTEEGALEKEQDFTDSTSTGSGVLFCLFVLNIIVKTNAMFLICEQERLRLEHLQPTF